jgi:hypothetical protein
MSLVLVVFSLLYFAPVGGGPRETRVSGDVNRDCILDQFAG